MNATVLYSKIANSSLPTEIQGEEGEHNARPDQYNRRGKIYSRLAAASGKDAAPEAQDISVVTDKDEYYYRGGGVYRSGSVRQTPVWNQQPRTLPDHVGDHG